MILTFLTSSGFLIWIGILSSTLTGSFSITSFVIDLLSLLIELSLDYFSELI